MKNIKNKNGFTLIELILYVAIVAIFMLALIPFIWGIIQGSARNAAKQEVFSNARFVSEKIKSEIRNSNGFNTSNFDVNLANNPGMKLSLIQDAPNNPTDIDVSAGKVRVKRGASAVANLNSDNTKVTNLTFTNYSSVDNKTKNIAFEIIIEGNYTSARTEYTEIFTLKSDVEIRSNN